MPNITSNGVWFLKFSFSFFSIFNFFAISYVISIFSYNFDLITIMSLIIIIETTTAKPKMGELNPVEKPRENVAPDIKAVCAEGKPP